MTSTELRAIGLARFGPRWQSPLARAIGVDPRHIRRLAAGQLSISEGIAHAVQAALGVVDIESLAWPRDEWILGDAGADNDREYLIHAHPPRFIARVVELDDDGLCDQDTDLLTGIVYTAPDGITTLCELVWLDPTPPEADLQRLLAAGAAHIAAES
jgi:hypothetical protein